MSTQKQEALNETLTDALVTRNIEQRLNVLNLNKKGAYIKNVGRIYRQELSEKMGSDVFTSTRDFKDENANMPKVLDTVTEQRSGKLVKKYAEAGTAWLAHPDRLTFDAITFNPEKTGHYEGMFNKYKGLPYESLGNGEREGFELLDKHIKEVIAGGDEDVYEYIYSWLAFVFQKPGRKTGVVPVLKGAQGAGKGIFCNFLGDLIGHQHYQHVSTPQGIVGKFNPQLESCLLLFADEALFKGDHGAQNIFKALVTEPTLNIEKKGIDSKKAKNYINFIIASNEETVFNLSANERRYFIMQVGEQYAFNASLGQTLRANYFKQLGAHLDNLDVKCKFLGYLLSLDLSNFNVQDFPHTDAKQAELLSGLDSVSGWFYDELCNFSFEKEVSANAIYSRYIAHCDALKIGGFDRKTQRALGLYLNELGIKKKRTNQGNNYDLSNEKAIKDAFSTKHQIKFEAEEVKAFSYISDLPPF